VRVDIGEAEVEARGSVAPGQSVLLCLRPEDLMLAAADTAAPIVTGQMGGQNVLVGTVVRILPSDSSIRVVLDCGFPVVALVTRAAYRKLKLEPGHRAQVSFSAADAHLIPRGSEVPPL
jgi:ABC-type molybdate transport system ATPase subunit